MVVNVEIIFIYGCVNIGFMLIIFVVDVLKKCELGFKVMERFMRLLVIIIKKVCLLILF